MSARMCADMYAYVGRFRR